ncbi:RNA polymerase sigma factor [Symbioplanes lichenis]|uniref:RNA polymerase sigma factor n=1 Tax=Symbioplanes lichenis TaxID=1629072 RepID=UPI002739F824|nr:sigma factor-like helix-turn-helix DNA-binding protein [Actinoplanes lichenis]
MDADDDAVEAAAVPPAGTRVSVSDEFVAFFRVGYQPLLRTVMYFGASGDQAEDAAQAAMIEVGQRWSAIQHPQAYAQKAAISHLIRIKNKEALDRERVQQACQGTDLSMGRLDPHLTLWEDSEWVKQLLDGLPPKQREVMSFVIDGFQPAEIAILLGRSSDAVRQNLMEARLRLMKELEREQAAENDGGKRGRRPDEHC